MSTTVLGKVSMTPKGAWNASTSYEPLDVVSYGGNAFLARRTNSNVTPTEGADWQMIAEKATIGNLLQTTGENTDAAMSQKAVTDELYVVKDFPYSSSLMNMEQGAIYAGADSSSDNYIRTSGFIRVKKGDVLKIVNQSTHSLQIAHYLYKEEKTTSYDSSAFSDYGYTNVAIGETKEVKLEVNGYYRIRCQFGNATAVTPSDLTNTFYIKNDNIDKYKFNVTNGQTSSYLSRYCGLFGAGAADSYLFFTDPHLLGGSGSFDNDRLYKYLNVLKETNDVTPTNFVVNCGDWLNEGDTPNQAKMKLGYISALLKNNFKECHNVVGNHDYNYLGTEVLDNQTIANILSIDNGNCYYKFDSPASRYFVFDTYTDYEPGMSAYKWTQLKWFCQLLKDEDKPHNAIFMHIYWLTYGTTENSFSQWVGRIVYAYNHHETATYIDGQSYDFSGCTGHVDYVMCGHSHRDFNTTLKRNNGDNNAEIPVIGCTHFKDGNTPTFDLVYVDYGSKKINTVRIGTGSDREISFDV